MTMTDLLMRASSAIANKLLLVAVCFAVFAGKSSMRAGKLPGACPWPDGPLRHAWHAGRYQAWREAQ